MTTAENIRRRQRIGNVLEALTLLVVIAVFGYQLFYVNPENATTRTALCLLRSDLQSRVDQTESFLQHPNKFPEFNDPKIITLTRQQVDGQMRTIDALNVLGC